ncbi:MAG: hypothetical protein KF768_13795 [Phycisphaeraceae bacterium]|nr:hypothetical protein [Phycisphaeraceae bacterium]
MLNGLGRLYSRRIVNVNVNILLANFLALVLTALVVHLGKHIGLHDLHGWFIVGFTFVVDLTFDVVLYYGLHWVANHWPRRLHGPVSQTTKHLLEETPKPSFFRDATIVQGQRLVLSPLFYLIAFGGQKLALIAQIQPAWTVIIGYGAASIITRTAHTIWMIQQERSAERRRQHVSQESKAAA